MRRISCWIGLAAITLTFAGCFPAADKGDVSESDLDTSGPDTSEAGDTGPQADTSSVDTASADTATPDTAVADTAAPECDGPEDCGHLAGICTKVVCLGGTCAAQPDGGGSCDDGDPCTQDDVCSGFSCAGTAYACDDGEACTDDVCDGEGGCDYPAKAGGCWIAGACYAIGETKPGDPCRVCAGGESWSPNDGATCSDGDDVCTLGDTCDGTECIGGPPPDDSVGDWVTNVVTSVAPQTSSVRAIHPVGLGHWLFVADVKGGATVPTTSGDVLVEGNQLVAVRRAPASTYVQLRTEGYSKASYAASDDGNGRAAIAIDVTGDGSVYVGAELFALSEAVWNVLVVLDQLGDASLVTALSHDVEAIALLADATTVVSGTTNFGLFLDGLDSFQVAEADEFDPFVVHYGLVGEVDWVGHVATRAFWTADVRLAATEDGGFFMAFPFRSQADADFPEGLVTLNSASPRTTAGFLRVSAQGAVTASFAPFAFETELQSAVLANAPSIQALGSSDLLIQVGGIADETLTVAAAENTSTVLRLDAEGNPVWGRMIAGLLPLGKPGMSQIVGAGMGTETSPFSIAALDGTLLHQGSSSSVPTYFALNHDGDLLWVADAALQPAGGVAVPMSVRQSLSGSQLVVGGTLIGASAYVHPTDAEFTVSSGAEQSAWAALLNSDGGLSCASPH